MLASVRPRDKAHVPCRDRVDALIVRCGTPENGTSHRLCGVDGHIGLILSKAFWKLTAATRSREGEALD